MNFAKRNRMLVIFKALANANRIAILKAIASTKEKGMSVSDIAHSVKLSQPKASDHLKLLRIQKIVAAKQTGTRMDYVIKDPIVLELLTFVD